MTRVIRYGYRGGSWNSRSTTRIWDAPSYQSNSLGFRFGFRPAFRLKKVKR